jgi:hypothetical protein
MTLLWGDCNDLILLHVDSFQVYGFPSVQLTIPVFWKIVPEEWTFHIHCKVNLSIIVWNLVHVHSWCWYISGHIHCQRLSKPQILSIILMYTIKFMDVFESSIFKELSRTLQVLHHIWTENRPYINSCLSI